MESNLLDNRWPHLWHYEDDHRIWHGNHMGTRYRRPAVMYKGKKMAVSRLVLEEKLGRALKIGENACHIPSCHSRSCVEPSHLYAGTQSQNMMDQPKEVRRAKAMAGGMGLAAKLENAK